jgi:hypothetical protein
MTDFGVEYRRGMPPPKGLTTVPRNPLAAQAVHSRLSPPNRRARVKITNRLNVPIAGLLLVTGVMGPVRPASAAFPGSNGKIAFTRYKQGDHEIFAINPDGSGLSNLTDNNRDDYWPDWSADGTEISFIGDGGDLYIMNADGSGQTKLLDNTCIRCRAPSWSPDGTQIAFRFDHDGNTDIYLINVGGTGLTPLSPGTGTWMCSLHGLLTGPRSHS